MVPGTSMRTQTEHIRHYSRIIIFAWTILLLCSFYWFYHQHQNNILEIARAEARVAFEKDALYRKWVTSHGGVYVPIQGKTIPNPYLSHILERDIATPSGRPLTLINPAYMTRQVFELAEREKSYVRGHITSLNPIRPENKPDPWESGALRAFETGSKEVSELLLHEGRESLRLMRPFITETGCLKCHAAQGYRIGDVRGGISVTIPMSVFSGYTRKMIFGGAATHGLIWIFGIGMVQIGARALSRSVLALQESEERYRIVADYTADWEYWLTPEGTFNYVSPSCETFCGYTQKEFYDNPELLLQIVHPEDRERYNGHIHDMAANGGFPEPIDVRIITRSGQQRWISHVCREIFSNDGSNLGRRVSNRDITERKRAEKVIHEQTMLLEKEIAERQVAQEALQEQAIALEEEVAEHRQTEETLRLSEDKFSKSFDNAPLIMSITTMEEGIFLDVNRKFIEVSGYSRNEIIGRTSLDTGWIRSEDRQLLMDEFTSKGRVSGVEIKLHTKTKDLICLYYGEIINIDGHSRFLSICLDVSEPRHLEEQLRHAQKMEAIGQLAGGVAHDFNNLLTVIMGYGNLLLVDAKLNDHQKENVDQIISASEKAAMLTRGLLAFSHKQVMNPKKADLNGIIQEVQKFLVRIIGEDIQLKCIFNEPDIKVNVDNSQIEQVLINLATNARDAMPKGGLFTIETSIHIIDDSFVAAYGCGSPGTYAQIAVSDSGFGMDEETTKRIFEPFFTTKQLGKGTGLGMAIVYGIIKQHNGFINVYSEPEKGTTFKIYLPAVGKSTSDDHEMVVPKPPRGGIETVLVAEDDAAVSSLVKTILESYGYTVILAVDGQDAIEKFAANKETIKLIIMDMIMPKKCGTEAYGQIRQLKADVRILYSSGYAMDFIRSRGELEGETEILMKPVQPLELLRKVRETLDR